MTFENVAESGGVLPSGPPSGDEDWAESLLDGEMPEAEAKALLVAMAERGETAQEIVTLARAVRARLVPVKAPAGAIDVCGTGGDGAHSLNVSTAVALVVAASGVPMAKHGNRSASSRAGAADTLEALGLPLDLTPQQQEVLLGELGIAFLFAPAHHPALAAMAPLRRAIGRRTVFNLVGPLANPASVDAQLIGVSHPALVDGYAEAVRQLGYASALVVAGEDPLDELSISAPSHYAWIRAGAFGDRGIITPEMARLARAPAGALAGGDAQDNGLALQRLLAGEVGPYRDAVVLNSASALCVAGHDDDWRTGLDRARAAIDSGAAAALLNRWVATAQALQS